VRKYRNYSDKDVIEKSKESQSMAELLRKLNLKDAGGNYANLKKIIQKLNVDTNHWKNQGWSKNLRLKDWSKYSKIQSIKKHLILERTNRCEKCKLDTWMEEPINLEIHHKDGDRTNNELENLSLLCCNCHSMTKNWRNKKRVGSPTAETTDLKSVKCGFDSHSTYSEKNENS
jgi:hypothetical protein